MAGKTSHHQGHFLPQHMGASLAGRWERRDRGKTHGTGAEEGLDRPSKEGWGSAGDFLDKGEEGTPKTCRPALWQVLC